MTSIKLETLVVLSILLSSLLPSNSLVLTVTAIIGTRTALQY